MAIGPSAAAAPASGIAANGPERTVKFRDGIVVPALGQGSARLGQGRHPETVEEEALREGISLGMTLIDTAEIYGNGDAEKLIGRVIAGRRQLLQFTAWLVSVSSSVELGGVGRCQWLSDGPGIVAPWPWFGVAKSEVLKLIAGDDDGEADSRRIHSQPGKVVGDPA
jgi:Aldo/keto reductase family